MDALEERRAELAAVLGSMFRTAAACGSGRCAMRGQLPPTRCPGLAQGVAATLPLVYGKIRREQLSKLGFIDRDVLQVVECRYECDYAIGPAYARRSRTGRAGWQKIRADRRGTEGEAGGLLGVVYGRANRRASEPE